MTVGAAEDVSTGTAAETEVATGSEETAGSAGVAIGSELTTGPAEVATACALEATTSATGLLDATGLLEAATTAATALPLTAAGAAMLESSARVHPLFAVIAAGQATC